MSKGNPTVSIVMAVHNMAAHIRESIQSLLNQIYQDFELIIIDDGSTDKTVDVIHQFLDERIMVKRLSHQGLAVALNIGIRLARGEYIARMDADDIAMPERLEKQIRYLIQHPKVAACGTAYPEIKIPACISTEVANE